jgi:hypothetical protein
VNPEHYTSELKPPATPPSFTLWMSPLFRTRCSTSCTPSHPPPHLGTWNRVGSGPQVFREPTPQPSFFL